MSSKAVKFLWISATNSEGESCWLMPVKFTKSVKRTVTSLYCFATAEPVNLISSTTSSGRILSNKSSLLFSQS